MTDGDGSGHRVDWYDDEMQEVVRFLDGWAASAERCDDGLIVDLRGGRLIRIVLTPDQLSNLSVVGLTSAAAVADDLIQTLRTLPDWARYVVFSQYVMVPSRTAVLQLPPTTAPGSGR